jgi:hypothetical protein
MKQAEGGERERDREADQHDHHEPREHDRGEIFHVHFYLSCGAGEG